MPSPLKKPKYGAYYGRTTSPTFFLKKNDVLSTMANETPSINLVSDHQQCGWKIKQGFFGSKH
jgi:hypothetical protein